MLRERIRYRQEGEILESVRTWKHPTNGAQYKVLLDLTKLSYSIVDAETKLEALTGTAVSRAKLQLAAREGLVSLGVLLKREERKEYSKKIKV